MYAFSFIRFPLMYMASASPKIVVDLTGVEDDDDDDATIPGSPQDPMKQVVKKPILKKLPRNLSTLGYTPAQRRSRKRKRAVKERIVKKEKVSTKPNVDPHSAWILRMKHKLKLHAQNWHAIRKVAHSQPTAKDIANEIKNMSQTRATILVSSASSSSSSSVLSPLSSSVPSSLIWSSPPSAPPSSSSSAHPPSLIWSAPPLSSLSLSSSSFPPSLSSAPPLSSSAPSSSSKPVLSASPVFSVSILPYGCVKTEEKPLSP